MHDSAIRHLAACGNSPLIAAALFERTVQIWSLENALQIGEFETTLDFGGHRLALAAEGSICVTGSWKAGLAAYSVPSGSPLWHRPDLVENQIVTVDGCGRHVYCGFERKPLAVIDVYTGDVIETIAGALGVTTSLTGADKLIEEKKRYRVEGAHSLEIMPASFAMHDAALSPEAVCISEPRIGIRCIELASGSLLWHHSSIESNHLTFSACDYEFYCVAAKERAPHESSLIRLAGNLMNCDLVAAIGDCWEAVFAYSGKLLITMRGDVYETSTGRLTKQLAFPTCDYPDSL